VFDRFRGSKSAEAAVAALVFADGVEEVALAEVGPEFFDDDHFGVADLPEEEVENDHFRRGSDDWVGIDILKSDCITTIKKQF
jgi:hypothetical protein